MQENEKINNETGIHDIYDRMFKRIFSLSNLAIINLINGLFGTNYPPKSTVSYPNKESVSTILERRLADEIVVIQGTPYHLEAQMKKDGAIVLRVFEYGFHYAMNSRTDDDILNFPAPIIIYLNDGANIPEKSTIQISFRNQGTFTYEIQNFVYQAHDICELNQRKLITLIPFHLLKFKSLIAKNPSKENFQLLQSAILDDIIGSIKANLQVGNITIDELETENKEQKKLSRRKPLVSPNLKPNWQNKNKYYLNRTLANDFSRGSSLCFFKHHNKYCN